MKKIAGVLAVLGLLAALGVGLFAFSGIAWADDGDEAAADNTPGPGYGWCHGGYGPGMMGFGWGGQAYLKRIGDLIGMTPADITAQQNAGSSLADIAGTKGVGEDKLIDYLLQPTKEMMQVAVKYNYLTQDQFNNMLNFMTQRMKQVVEYKGAPAGGPGVGPQGGPGPGPRGRRSSDSDANGWGPGRGGMMGRYAW
ncbi:MAG: hypothetical protein M1380_00380 [Chloroflexi bacterium]|nr:hypothetical protein [Chloroflexota bacterium]MCL5026652.1 hypothetical protein [Chloroflexota bacterium]